MHIEEINRIMDLQAAQCRGDPDCIARVNDERIRLIGLAIERMIGDMQAGWRLPKTPPEAKPTF